MLFEFISVVNVKYSYTGSARVRTSTELVTSETLFFTSTMCYNSVTFSFLFLLFFSSSKEHVTISQTVFDLHLREISHLVVQPSNKPQASSVSIT